MFTHSFAYPRLVFAVSAALLISVLLSLQGCQGQPARSTTINSLVAGGGTGRQEVKVAGVVSTEPTQTGSGKLFFITDDKDPSKQVAVFYDKLRVLEKDRGPKGYKGRPVVVTGTYDGRILTATSLIARTYTVPGAP